MSLQINSISSSSAPSRRGINSKLKALGVPDDIISQGPQAVKEYTQEHNISIPEPPKKEGGAQQQGLFDNQKPAQDITQQLSSLGVPNNVISSGKDAVEKYANQNNITLPQPPRTIKPQNAGEKLDLSA